MKMMAMVGLRDIEASLRPTQAQLDQIRKHRSAIENLLRSSLSRFDFSCYYAGSYAKNTAINTSLDLDLVLRFPSSSSVSTRECYEAVYDALRANNWNPRRKNAAIRISQLSLPGNTQLEHADIVPEKQIGNGDYCYLWLSRDGQMLQTSVHEHIGAVSRSGMHDLIRLMKFWKIKHNLEYPSFILEQCVLRWAQDEPGCANGDINTRLQNHVDYVARRIENLRLIDPANNNNVITNPNDFPVVDKRRIADTARATSTYTKNQDWNSFFKARF